MFGTNAVRILCDKNDLDGVKQLLEDGFYEQDCINVVTVKNGVLYIEYLVRPAVLVDGKVIYTDDVNMEGIGPSDVFKKVKETYPNVELGGVIEIGDDNSRNYFIFNSPNGSKDVLEDYAYQTDKGEWIPVSKCWFYYIATTDYAPLVIAYEKKKDFEKFLKSVNKCAANNDMELEEFFDTDEFLDFLYDNDYYFPDYEDEIDEFWEAVMKKYNESK